MGERDSIEMTQAKFSLEEMLNMGFQIASLFLLIPIEIKIGCWLLAFKSD